MPKKNRIFSGQKLSEKERERIEKQLEAARLRDSVNPSAARREFRREKRLLILNEETTPQKKIASIFDLMTKEQSKEIRESDSWGSDEVISLAEEIIESKKPLNYSSVKKGLDNPLKPENRKVSPELEKRLEEDPNAGIDPLDPF